MYQWSGWGLAGESGHDDHVPLDVCLVIPLFGLAVLRIALVAYVVAGVRVAWFAGDRTTPFEQHA
jgi:hypothetical protein